MQKTFEEWEEIKNETVEDLTGRLKPDISELCPPVIIALDVLRIPQAGIAAVLKTKQPRISLFQQGKRKMSIPEQERLCDLVDAMLEKIEGERELHDLVEPEQVQDYLKVQLDYARILSTIQRAIIKKDKEDCYEENNNA